MEASMKHWLTEQIVNEDIPISVCAKLIKAARNKMPLHDLVELEKAERNPKDELTTHPIGVIGNVWVRQQYYPSMLVEAQGHLHHHDHVSLLAKGSLKVCVDGFEPAIYKAPTFFKIKAEHRHKLIPLEDETIAYCIFALRDENGEMVDELDDNTKHYTEVKLK